MRLLHPLLDPGQEAAECTRWSILVPKDARGRLRISNQPSDLRRDGRICTGDPLTPSHVPGVAGRGSVLLSGHLTRLDSRLASLGVA